MKTIIYIGYNDLRVYKRGVENVIWFQSCNNVFHRTIYLAICDRNGIYMWNNMICISIKKNILCYIKLNMIIWYLKHKYGNVFIHSHSIVLSCLLFCKTDILTIHDALYYQRKCDNVSPLFIYKIIEQLSVYKTKYIHYISEFTKKNCLLNKYKGKDVIIPNTSPIELLPFTDKEIQIDKDEISIFTVRGIQNRNRIDILYELGKKLDNVKIYNKRAHLYIAGKGPLLDTYREMVINNQLKSITFLGFIPDEVLLNYYKKCNVVIMLTEYAEGFGLPIIEGYYYNKPVVASDRCAIPEVIISPEHLCDNAVDSIIYRIKIALANSYNYRDYYDKNFSNKIIIGKYNDLYKKLIK